MSPRDNNYLTTLIVRELEKGGALNDPRPRDRPTPLADHAQAEARRSIERGRRLQTGDLARAARNFKKWVEQQADFSDAERADLIRGSERRLTAADYHKAGKALQSPRLEAVRQTPPPRADGLKYRCAKEAFDLMTFFSAKKPTRYRVRMIAALIYEGVTGKPHTDVNMKRSTDLVVTDRLKHHPEAFKR